MVVYRPAAASELPTSDHERSSRVTALLHCGEGSLLSSQEESDAIDIDPDEVSYVSGTKNVTWKTSPLTIGSQGGDLIQPTIALAPRAEAMRELVLLMAKSHLLETAPSFQISPTIPIRRSDTTLLSMTSHLDQNIASIMLSLLNPSINPRVT